MGAAFRRPDPGQLKLAPTTGLVPHDDYSLAGSLSVARTPPSGERDSSIAPP